MHCLHALHPGRFRGPIPAFPSPFPETAALLQWTHTAGEFIVISRGSSFWFPRQEAINLMMCVCVVTLQETCCSSPQISLSCILTCRHKPYHITLGGGLTPPHHPRTLDFVDQSDTIFALQEEKTQVSFKNPILGHF